MTDAIALQVLQQAALELARWADATFNPPFGQVKKPLVIEQAEAILGWAKAELAPLRLVFDQIELEERQGGQNYRPAWALDIQAGEKYPRIPYAQTQSPSSDLQVLQAAIQKALPELKNWDNLAQLTLFVEKFGSHLSLGDSNVALIDMARSLAAVAASLAQKPEGKQLALIGGDLMVVQKFIYTISSEGALKSLRARSFYLELATEEIVQQLLETLELPRTNIIYAGASKFYLLAPVTKKLEQIAGIQAKFNDWLLETFQRKVFLAIAHTAFSADVLNVQFTSDNSLAQIWQTVNDKLSVQATRKFASNLDRLLEQKDSHSPCKVCHRDDLPEEHLKPLKGTLAEDSILVCDTCQQMYDLGDRLPEVQALVRSHRPYDEDDIQVQSAYYHPVDHFNWNPGSNDMVFQINCWDLSKYSSNQVTPLLLGRYFERSELTNGFLSAGEMVEKSKGIKRVGYLRMDVDRLSQIFSKGLGTAYTLPRLTSLSRQMTYFFKVYLNSLAQHRRSNFLAIRDSSGNSQFEFLKPESDRPNLLFIYAGGDDLFVSGAWNEIVEFAFDVYQSFRAYTGYHPKITLSGGISLAGAKFPIYQAAKEAGDAEDEAKDNGRDSLCLFGEVFQWDRWLGKQGVDEENREYLTQEALPDLLGVLPFVRKFLDPEALGIGYPQSFIRNLLITAQLREQKIEETRKNHPHQENAVAYYLHLPKLAYALSRLPSQIRTHQNFAPIRRSLMSPRNSPYFRAIATWIELINR